MNQSSNLLPSSLTDELADELEQATLDGTPRVEVLRRHGVSVSTLHTWRRIARGEIETWHHGRPISDEMRARCRNLWEHLLEAELKYATYILREDLAVIKNAASRH